MMFALYVFNFPFHSDLLEQISSWLAEKFEIADDESYRELTNLPGKVKKHQAFEAEITANKERLDKLNEVASQWYTHKNDCVMIVKITKLSLCTRSRK